MVGGEAGTESNESNISTADLYEADEQAETKKLTEDQINTVVGMYQQYLNQWSANANVLGVQNPFFLDFNDDTDGLGILGQMLALDGKSVQDIRDGKVSYDDLTGMIFTFTYGDKLGIKYYGPDVTNARDEALAAVTASGAQTKAQKLLVLNDWLAHNNTFDMSYIMNSGKESNDDKPMIAKDPQKQEHEGEVYDEIYKCVRCPPDEPTKHTFMSSDLLHPKIFYVHIRMDRISQCDGFLYCPITLHNTYNSLKNNPQIILNTPLPNILGIQLHHFLKVRDIAPATHLP